MRNLYIVSENNEQNLNKIWPFQGSLGKTKALALASQRVAVSLLSPEIGFTAKVTKYLRPSARSIKLESM